MLAKLICAFITLLLPMSQSLHGCTLFDEDDQPIPTLAQILQLVGMDIADADIATVNAWAQQNLLRSKERWDEQSRSHEALKAQLLPLFEACGMTQRVKPRYDQYAGAIIHGSLLNTTRQRLNFLIDVWKEGTRFPCLYFLTGDRPLEQQIESFDNLGTSLQTECEMIQELWRQADAPAEMREKVQVFFVRVPMHLDPLTGLLRRPTTDDTVLAWLALNPNYGCYLAVSNAPYICRQDLVMQTLAPQYSYDAVGQSFNTQERVAILLDELARLIYQTYINRNSRP